MSGTTTTPATDGRSPAHADARGIRSPRTDRGLGSPGLLRLGTSRIGYETKGYFRSPDAVFFTFLFPLIMLGIFTAAFSSAGDIQPGPGAEGVSVGAYYLPGMLAAELAPVVVVVVSLMRAPPRRHVPRLRPSAPVAGRCPRGWAG